LKSPVPFDIQTQIGTLLMERLKTETRLAPNRAAATISPAFIIERFTLANGALRYHVRAEWRSDKETGNRLLHSFVAWMAAEPALRILLIEPLAASSDAIIEQKLLSVVDLGQGRTGVVLSRWGSAFRELRLVEYRDGSPVPQMRTLHLVNAGD
jgi:hypothetical protein